jgi:hypothetical protein
MVGKVGTTLMTKEERWKAAIAEAEPLIKELRRIRDKYGLIRLNVSATNYVGLGRYGDVEVGGDPDVPVPVGEVRYLSYGGNDGKKPYWTRIVEDKNNTVKHEKPEDMEEEVE